MSFYVTVLTPFYVPLLTPFYVPFFTPFHVPLLIPFYVPFFTPFYRQSLLAAIPARYYSCTRGRGQFTQEDFCLGRESLSPLILRLRSLLLLSPHAMKNENDQSTNVIRISKCYRPVAEVLFGHRPIDLSTSSIPSLTAVVVCLCRDFVYVE